MGSEWSIAERNGCGIKEALSEKSQRGRGCQWTGLVEFFAETVLCRPDTSHRDLLGKIRVLVNTLQIFVVREGLWQNVKDEKESVHWREGKEYSRGGWRHKKCCWSYTLLKLPLKSVLPPLNVFWVPELGQETGHRSQGPCFQRTTKYSYCPGISIFRLLYSRCWLDSPNFVKTQLWLLNPSMHLSHVP